MRKIAILIIAIILAGLAVSFFVQGCELKPYKKWIVYYHKEKVCQWTYSAYLIHDTDNDTFKTCIQIEDSAITYRSPDKWDWQNDTIICCPAGRIDDPSFGAGESTTDATFSNFYEIQTVNSTIHTYFNGSRAHVKVVTECGGYTLAHRVGQYYRGDPVYLTSDDCYLISLLCVIALCFIGIAAAFMGRKT